MHNPLKENSSTDSGRGRYGLEYASVTFQAGMKILSSKEFPAYHGDKLIANYIYAPLSPGSSRHPVDTIFSTSGKEAMMRVL